MWGSGYWGAGNIYIVVDVWHLTELVYRAAPTHLEGGPACTHHPALRHTALNLAFMKHGNKVLVSKS